MSSSTTSSVSVIVPAAGSGTRFGEGANKIFQRLEGRELFLRALDLFAERSDVIQKLLVVSAEDRDRLAADFADPLDEMDVTLVEGGATRTDSVRSALAKVDDAAELVCVHDAVRPCVADPWINAVFAMADAHGAAILACPVHGTLKRVDARDTITDTVPRDGLWEAQTPQVFRRELLQRAYAGGAEATDDAHLVEQLGEPVCVVPGDPRNVKITTPGDLELAAAVLDTLRGLP